MFLLGSMYMDFKKSSMTNLLQKSGLSFCFVFRAVAAAYEVPRLGVILELQLPVYITAIATQDPSHLNLHHVSPQRRILNPLRKARDGTRILMKPSRVRKH